MKDSRGVVDHEPLSSNISEAQVAFGARRVVVPTPGMKVSEDFRSEAASESFRVCSRSLEPRLSSQDWGAPSPPPSQRIALNLAFST